LQNSMAWFSSQPSHTTLFGSACLLPEDEEGKAAASTVDAKWLMGREEAAVVEIVLFPFCFSSFLMISKTARHIGHLKGALPSYVKLMSRIEINCNRSKNELCVFTVCNPFVKTSETR